MAKKAETEKSAKSSQDQNLVAEDKVSSGFKLKTNVFKSRKVLVILGIILLVGVAAWLYAARNNATHDDNQVSEDPNATAQAFAESLENAEFTKDITDEGQAYHHYNTANAYKQVGDDEKALESLLKSYETYPHIWVVAFEIANMYSTSGDNDKKNEFLNRTAQLLEESISKSSRETMLISEHYTLGDVYQQLGNNAKAKDSFEKVLKWLEETGENEETKGDIEDVQNRIRNL